MKIVESVQRTDLFCEQARVGFGYGGRMTDEHSLSLSLSLAAASCCTMMVGLRALHHIPAGAAIVPPIPPLAASLSDSLLPSFCSSCFGPLPSDSTLACPCPGPCHASIIYCSIACRDIDLGLHWISGECCLLALLTPMHSFQHDSSLLTPERMQTLRMGTGKGEVLIRESSLADWPDLWQGSKSFSALGGTCDLRTALRLIAYYQAHQDIPNLLALQRKDEIRLGGLMSNRCKLIDPLSIADDRPWTVSSGMNNEHRQVPSPSQVRRECCTQKPLTRGAGEYECTATIDNELIELGEQIKEAALLIGFARHLTARSTIACTHKSPICIESVVVEDSVIAEEAICQVLTNGVQIQVIYKAKDGPLALDIRTRNLGTAAYGPLFSWFNHSCRPNACFSFRLEDYHSPVNAFLPNVDPVLVPDVYITARANDGGLEVTPDDICSLIGSANRKDSLITQSSQSKAAIARAFMASYSLSNQHSKTLAPRITVRTTRQIKVDEEVFLAYTDLLQPKSLRKQELWKKYRFNCKCDRCTASPTGYADRVLQYCACTNFSVPGGPPFAGQVCETALVLKEMLHEKIEHGITAFIVHDDPLSCCYIIESALKGLLQEGFLDENLKHDGSKQQLDHGKTRVNLMQRLLLDAYIALASAYRVLAESTDLTKAHEIKVGMQGDTIMSEYYIRSCKWLTASEYYRASTAYTFLLASIVYGLFQGGEHGLIVHVAQFWLDVGKALLMWATEIEKELPGLSKSQTFGARYLRTVFEMSGGDQYNRAQRDHSLIDNIYVTDSRLKVAFCDCFVELIDSLWPMLKLSSPFLQAIVNPSSLEVNVQSSDVNSDGSLNNVCDCTLIVKAAYTCLHYSRYLLEICYGSKHLLVEAVEDLLSATGFYC